MQQTSTYWVAANLVKLQVEVSSTEPDNWIGCFRFQPDAVFVRDCINNQLEEYVQRIAKEAALTFLESKAQKEEEAYYVLRSVEENKLDLAVVACLTPAGTREKGDSKENFHSVKILGKFKSHSDAMLFCAGYNARTAELATFEEEY